MRLVITSPVSVAVDVNRVAHVRAEDATGAFGILSGAEDFLTTLALSVVSWRLEDGREGHCAVRGGVFTVRRGTDVSVATREAVVGTDLVQLEKDVVQRFRQTVGQEESARSSAAQLHLAAIRQIIGYLRPERRPVAGPGE